MSEIVRVEGVTKRFGDVTALSGVSFAIDGPKIVGILGPNGAGKTTLLDLLEGLAEPTTGTIRLFGAPLRPYPRRRVGVVMQKECVLDNVTTGEYAELFAAIFGVRGGAGAILRAAELDARARTPMQRLSGGEAQRLHLALAVAHEPELVFLDEPTAHLDPDAKRRLGERVKQLGRERTVVLCTHDLHEADALCDELVFLVGGRVRASGPRDELVRAVPPEVRRGAGVEDAFFHFCAVRIGEGGDST